MMINPLLVLAGLGVASASGGLQFFEQPDCTIVASYTDTAVEGCEQPCQTIPDTNIHGMNVLDLEPNAQVLVFLNENCSGTPYAAIGQAYGSSNGLDSCVPSTTDPIRSYLQQGYKGSDNAGGQDCPGTHDAPTAPFPKPTG